MATTSQWCFEYRPKLCHIPRIPPNHLYPPCENCKKHSVNRKQVKNYVGLSKSFINYHQNWKEKNCKYAWTNLIETEIDLIEVNLGHSIAGILSNYRANFQEMSRFTLNTMGYQLSGTSLGILQPMLRIVWDIRRSGQTCPPLCSWSPLQN